MVVIGATDVLAEGEADVEFVETQLDASAPTRASSAALPGRVAMSTLSAENPNRAAVAMTTTKGAPDLSSSGRRGNDHTFPLHA